MKLAVLIHIFFIHRHARHFCQKHIMAAQRNDLCHPAFNVYRAFFNTWGLDILGRQRRQLHLFIFVRIPPGLNSAVIRCEYKILCDQVYNELPGLFDNIIRIALRPYGYVKRGRSGPGCTAPGSRYNSAFRLLSGSSPSLPEPDTAYCPVSNVVSPYLPPFPHTKTSPCSFFSNRYPAKALS